MKCYSIIIAIIIHLSLTAVTASEQGPVEFRPEMFGHINKGCPENSECSPKLGELRKKWLTVLGSGETKQLEKFKKENGIPFTLWLLGQPNPDEVISWNSECRQHRKPNPIVYDGEIFLKNLKQKNENFYYDETILLEKNGTTKKFKIFRQEIPVQISEGKLHFIRNDDGLYYDILISHDENFYFIKKSSSEKIFPENIDCPEKLIKEFQNRFEYNRIYAGHFCKKIWNGKDYQLMIFGRSCF